MVRPGPVIGSPLIPREQMQLFRQRAAMAYAFQTIQMLSLPIANPPIPGRLYFCLPPCQVGGV